MEDGECGFDHGVGHPSCICPGPKYLRTRGIARSGSPAIILSGRRGDQCRNERGAHFSWGKALRLCVWHASVVVSQVEERYDRLLPRQEERERKRALKVLERLGYAVTLDKVA